jgi:hypothetical protein
MTIEGLCYLDEIHLGFGANLTNGCTIMPSTRISFEILVEVLLWLQEELLAIILMVFYFVFQRVKCLLECLIIHLLLMKIHLRTLLIIALFIHLIVFCALYRYSNSTRKKRSHFLF